MTKKTKIMTILIFFVTTLLATTVQTVQAARYTIPTGTRYYESSFGFGSGRQGRVGNKYTLNPGKIRIPGYSYLDKNGEVIISDYKEEAEIIDIPDPPENARKLFLHFCTQKYRNGWIDSDDMIVIE